MFPKQYIGDEGEKHSCHRNLRVTIREILQSSTPNKNRVPYFLERSEY